MAAALAEAEQRSPASARTDRRSGNDRSPVVGVTISEGAKAVRDLGTVAEQSAAVTTTKPSELRRSVEVLAEAIRQVLAATGLPEIAPAEVAKWSLVVPVSKALRDAEATVADSPRVARALHAARGQLLAAAAALADPQAHAEQAAAWGIPHLGIAVPGPDGLLPDGVFATAADGRYKNVLWASSGDPLDEAPLARIAGRPEGFRYRWQDARVWEQLAHDMIVVGCGWRSRQEWLPSALRGPAQAALARQLRQDLGSGDWALHAREIVRWLVRTRYVSVISSGPEADPLVGASTINPKSRQLRSPGARRR